MSGAQANSAAGAGAGHLWLGRPPVLGSTVAFLALLMIPYGYSLPWVQ